MTAEVNAGSKKRVIAIVFAKDWSSSTWVAQTIKRLKRLGAIWWHPGAAGIILLRTNSTDETIGAALRPKDPYTQWPYTIDITGSEAAATGIEGVEEWLASGDLPTAIADATRRAEAAAKIPHLEYGQFAPPNLPADGAEAAAGELPGMFGPVGWTNPICELLDGFIPGAKRRPERIAIRQSGYSSLQRFSVPLPVARQIAEILKRHMDDYDLVTEPEYPGAGEYLAIAELAGNGKVTLHGFVVTSARTDERAEFRELTVDLDSCEREARSALMERARGSGALMGMGRGHRRSILSVYFPKR